MRLFVGVPVPEDVKVDIGLIQEKIILSQTDLKIVERENLHFTLKFLGDVPEENVASISSVLDDIRLKHRRFSVSLRGVGVFPTEKFVRVVWVGVEENKLFLSLTADIQKALEYIRREDYTETHPHLTVARVRSPHQVQVLVDVVHALKEVSFGEFTVDRFVLFQSALSREGVVYTPIRVFQLQAQ